MYDALIVITNCVIFCASKNIEIWEAVDLRAVTHFEGIEEYYNTRRSQRSNESPTEPDEPARRVRIKKTICKRILTSHFFRMHRIDWVNLEVKRVRDELKNERRDTFYTIFDEFEYETPYCLGPTSTYSGFGYDFHNRYTVRRVRISVDEVVDEHVFTCIGRDLETTAFKEYFISQPYNVNGVYWSYPLAGRFVFAYADENAQILSLVAMAEEGAIESWFVRVSKMSTWFYALTTSQSRFTPAETSDLDPVCSLSPAYKLRLCAALFSTSEFRDKITFFPNLNSVQLDCEKRTVASIFVEDGRFQEWVIGCRAFERGRNEIIYYVSRGSEANSIFVYVDGGEHKLLVHNTCNNVSVVDNNETNVDMDAVVEMVTNVLADLANEADEDNRGAGVAFLRDDVEN